MHTTRVKSTCVDYLVLVVTLGIGIFLKILPLVASKGIIMYDSSLVQSELMRKFMQFSVKKVFIRS